MNPRSSNVFHQGVPYQAYLKQIHHVWQPRSYLEIGVYTGATLGLAQCPAAAVDPVLALQGDPFGRRAETYLFQMTSDAFFARHSLKTFFPAGIDFAFLDGMHHFEFLLRDFFNTEKDAHENSVIAMHDCYPVNTEIANREASHDRRNDAATRAWWAGDVWKVLPILRDFRPDLDVVTLDCPPTGLVIVRNLDPGSKALIGAYDQIIAKYRDVSLESFGIERFRSEFSTIDSRSLYQPEALRSLLARERA
jgi:hypothetical protein